MDIQNRNRRMMRKSALAVSVAAMLGLPVAAYAATATNSSTADIVQAIAITSGTALDFGSVVAAGAAGTVEMGAAGTRTCATVTCVAQDAGTAASFDVTGEASYTYTVTLPASATLTDSAATPNSMTVDAFSHDSTGTLDTAGAETFNVGATLNVGADQVAGSYAGTFDVSVDYQ